MHIHESVRQCALFVGRVLKKGGTEEKRLIGTAFVVSVPTANRLLECYYIVTARHVADRLTSGGEWFIRYNKVDGIGEVRADERIKWCGHPDPAQFPSVDAAAIPFTLPSAFFHPIPVSMFATEEVIAAGRVGPGCEAFITGLFTKMTGGARNIPLLRTANVAMIPGEKIPNIRIGGWTGESEVYLVEVRSLGGLSGSPVFAIETLGMLGQRIDNIGGLGGKMYGHGDFYLLGLMNGHWLMREKESNDVDFQAVGSYDEGSIATGISVVVPAKKILEVLNHPDLMAHRAEKEREFRACSGTTTCE